MKQIIVQFLNFGRCEKAKIKKPALGGMLILSKGN